MSHRVLYELGDREAGLVVNKIVQSAWRSGRHRRTRGIVKESRSLRAWPSKHRPESPQSHGGSQRQKSHLYRASSKLSSVNPGKKSSCGMQKDRLPSAARALWFPL